MRKFNIVIPVFLFCIPAMLFATTGLRVIEDTQSGLVVRVTPDDWHRFELEDGFIPIPAGAGVDNRENSLAVPYYRTLIGLPSNKLPAIQVEKIQWGEWAAANIKEGKEQPRNQRIPVLDNGQPVIVGKPFLWRGKWVTDLYVIPVRIDGKGVRKLKDLQVRVTYKGNNQGGLSQPDRLSDKILLNHEASRLWSAAESKPLFRRSQSWVEYDELIRIEIEVEGIYEINRETLLRSGIDLGGYDPRSFRIYGNGGFVLNENIGSSRDSTLIENAIVVTGEDDGSWDEGDKILFYGRSVNSWDAHQPPGEYRHSNNPFTMRNVYWLVVPPLGSADGKRMETIGTTRPITYEATVARSRVFSENDNFIHHSIDNPESGKNWYAADLYGGDRYTTNFQLDQPHPEQEAVLLLGQRRIQRDGNALIRVLINGIEIESYSLTTSVHSIDIPAGVLNSGSNTFSYQVERVDADKPGHSLFDWFEINYLRSFETSLSSIAFDQLPDDGVASIKLHGLDAPWVFDIEDFEEVQHIRSDSFAVEAQVTRPRRYLAVSDGEFLTPSYISRDDIGYGEYPDGLRDQSLNADYLMIVHRDFWETAAALESYIEERDNIEVMRVLVSDIYDEFSWGLLDPTAIRDFLKYALYDWTDSDPVTCLFIGDGDYDYRNLIPGDDKNLIPPYENNQESRDDWFAEFDPSGGEPEYIMGRLPFQSNQELDNYVNKLMSYESDTERGAWRNRVIVVADDEYGEGGPNSYDKTHLQYSEALSRDHIPNYVELEKIYIGTYPTEFDPSTGERRKPLATQELIESLNRGALVVNYMGHGNAHVWAHESLLLDTRDNILINSGLREPIYVAATCSWGHFDRPNNEAFFEMLLGRKGGAIGAVAATRNTSGSGNLVYVQEFYAQFFDRINRRTLGESVLLAKINVEGPTNRYYHCFSEPNMIPAVPGLDMIVTDINPDSLVALQIGKVLGEVREINDDNPVTDYNGEAVVTVFDSYDSLTYTFFDGSTMSYRMPGGILFRGRSTVGSGDFLSTFMVPRDVSYGSSDSWIQMFASDGNKDAVGSKQGVEIAAIYADEFGDNTPPEINIYFDHRGWQDGDMTTPQPTLIIDLVDTSGINLTSEIGHDIKTVVDPGKANEITYNLTEDFIYERDSYTRGTAEHIITGLGDGRHELEVWAWDNANNMARKEILFITIGSGEDVRLENVVNVPNPFEERTHFTFEAIGADEAVIKIYTASGRHIKTIGPQTIYNGFNYIEWDGFDHYNDQIANGVYLYKVKVTDSSGHEDESIGKLLRIR
ncbi:MAG: type IX secretion system sortase PorU [Candidatus Electryonea clarkiae]|nr:type IX secretion system sortase PorU [Candidatus Electryonea clarkiae]MDP8287553.1 type IX secretion system sortase PorU [Candidatus Electryonea clarkiae]